MMLTDSLFSYDFLSLACSYRELCEGQYCRSFVYIIAFILL